MKTNCMRDFNHITAEKVSVIMFLNHKTFQNIVLFRNDYPLQILLKEVEKLSDFLVNLRFHLPNSICLKLLYQHFELLHYSLAR